MNRSKLEFMLKNKRKFTFNLRVPTDLLSECGFAGFTQTCQDKDRHTILEQVNFQLVQMLIHSNALWFFDCSACILLLLHDSDVGLDLHDVAPNVNRLNRSRVSRQINRIGLNLALVTREAEKSPPSNFGVLVYKLFTSSTV